MSSCSNAPVLQIPFQTKLDKERLIRKLSTKIAAEKGTILPMIQSFKNLKVLAGSRFNEPASGFIENNLDQIEAFYNHPENTLQQIAREDQGLEKLELLEAVYDEKDPDIVIKKMDQVNAEMGWELTERIQQVSDQSRTFPRLLTTGALDQIPLQTNSSNLPLNKKTVNLYSGVCLVALAGEIVCKHAGTSWLKVAGAATALAAYLAMAYNLYLWQDSFSALISTEIEESGSLVKTGALYPPNSNYVYQVVASTAIPLGYALKALPGEIPAIQAALNKWAAKEPGLSFAKFVQYGIIEIPIGTTVVNFVMSPGYIGFKISD